MHTCGYTLQRIHTPAPQQTQIDTYTDGHTHTRMQQHAKQTRTGVWCPSFHLRRSYSLSLSLALSFTHKLLSGGGLTVVMWHIAAVVAVCVWACICMCASLLMCIYLIVWTVLCKYAQAAFIYVHPLCVCVCVSSLSGCSLPAYCSSSPALVLPSECDLIQGLLWD